jgi:hypothetical protein
MNRICDASGICPHTPQCASFCQFTDATLETRKIAPYPIVPADIEPVSDTWQVIGSVVVGFVLVALVVIAALFFFTGLWIWSLLI